MKHGRSSGRSTPRRHHASSDTRHPKGSNDPPLFSIKHQQLLLDIFRNAFKSRLQDTNLATTMQQVKHHLYERDFRSAFGKQEFLEAYAVRWSPNRALAYAEILYSLPDVRAKLDGRPPGSYGERAPSPESPQPPPSSASKVNLEDHSHDISIVCMGGGAGAELAAVAGWMARLGSGTPAFPARANLTLIDVADWSTVLHNLHSNLDSGLLASNSQIYQPEEEMLQMHFEEVDVLKMSTKQLATMFHDVSLITFMFTLNELYSTSMSGTTNLILSITTVVRPGALLLVVDSPGSYSTVNVGRSPDVMRPSVQKKYPMQWLLEHTLLEAATIGEGKDHVVKKEWEKVESCDSKWFRLHKALRYPIDLEDMRYQLHLYRRL